MVKLAILSLAVFVLFGIAAHKEQDQLNKSKTYRTLFVLHLLCGTGLTIFAFVHGVSHISTASVSMAVTGVAALLLLVAELITGCVLKGNQAKGLKMLHIVFPVLCLLAAVVHILLAKIA